MRSYDLSMSGPDAPTPRLPARRAAALAGAVLLALALVSACTTAAPDRRAGSPAASSAPSPSSSSTPHPSTRREPETVTSDASIGALFPHGLSRRHTCTAGVVDSHTGDVVVTAAHCIAGSGAGTIFAPGYHDGKAPYGTWRVREAFAATPWIKHQDDQSDVAFLLLAPAKGGRSVQSVVGGSRISDRVQPGQTVEVLGYLSHKDHPVACTAKVYVNEGYPAFDCPGFAAGTSGSPWLVEPATHAAAPLVVGVIGGLRQGGCTAGTSYSAWFTPGTLALYSRAVSGTDPNVLPVAGSSC